MFIKIEKKILEYEKGVYTGVVVAYGLDNETPNKTIDDLLKKQIEKKYSELKGISVKSIESLDVYRNAFKRFDIESSKYFSSIESIYNRIHNKGEFPSISPVVDLGNYISMKYGIPVGVHDIDSLEGDLTIRLATVEDCEDDANNLENDLLKVGEPVYACGRSIRTRRWMWRQMPAGRVNKEAKNFIFPIDGFVSNKVNVESAVEELAAKIQELFGVTSESGFITAENRELVIGQMTEEEKDLENQITIMLKGVAQHTAVSDIREKLMDAKKENRPLRIKLGLDPSAPDIHIGHSVVLRKIRQLQEMGHKAIIIIGDYTGMIGDPTGKSKTRKQLSKEDVVENANTYMEQIFKIIDRDKTEVYYNSEWLSKMTFSDVINLASKCTVARMLERDDFNNRYTNHLPLSVHEFFYPLMQAYDSVAVNADIELGGTDQTFNILLGRNIQRDFGQEPQLTLFMPLLEGIDGIEKMSKSLGNYIGINEPANVIYEKVMKIPDSLIIKYYNLCTDVHPDRIVHYQELLDNGVNPRDIKMLLAHDITELYAGKEAADVAQEYFVFVFRHKGIPDDAPMIEIILDGDRALGELILDKLIEDGFYSSKSEVRRIFMQGGARIDDKKVTDIKSIVFNDKNKLVLRLGKNKLFIIQLKQE